MPARVCAFFVVVFTHFAVIRWKQCSQVHEECWKLLDLFYFISKIENFSSAKTYDNSKNIEAHVLSIGHQCERHESKWIAWIRNKNNTTNESIHLLIHLFQFAHINSSKFTTNGTLNYCRQLVGVYVFHFFLLLLLIWILFILRFFSSNFLLISMQCNVTSCYVIPINHKYIETFPWWYQKSHTAISIPFAYECITRRDEKNMLNSSIPLEFGEEEEEEKTADTAKVQIHEHVLCWVEMIRRTLGAV